MARLVFTAATAWECKILSHRIATSRHWFYIKKGIMTNLLLLKFQQVPPFKQFLLETTNRPLLHNVGNSWWGTGLDGTGLNTQGVLLMQLRDSHLRSVSGPDSPPVTVSVPDSLPVTVSVPDSPPVTVSVPDSPPVTVSVPDSLPVTVSVPDSPPVTVSVPDSPPVTVSVPDSPQVTALVPDSPPVTVSVPDSPPVTVSVPDSPPVSYSVNDVVSIFHVGGGPEEISAIVYTESNNQLPIADVISILKQPDMDKVSNIPPQHPKGGQVFLISDGNNKARQNNWTCDGYPWVNKGGYGVPKKNPIVFARKYTLRQHSGDLKGCEDFIRRAYFIKDSPFKLVHYVGDESKYVPRPHGNQKDQRHGDYRRTLPSVLRHIESNSTAQPMTMYREMTTKTKTTGPYQGVANPRNTGQIRNVTKTVRKKNRISHDQLYNVIQLGYHLQDFLKELTIFPDLCCIVAVDDILNDFNKALIVKSDEPLLVSYDTTFDLGDFFVSVLVYKHVMFQRGNIIPVAFMIHDRRSGELHDRFFRTIKSLVPNLSKGTPVIVTDREPGIAKVLKNYLSNCKHVFCWNHIKRDVVH